MTELYQSTVTEIGELVPAFIAEGMLVFFGEGAPEELRDFCIMHEVSHKQDQVMGWSIFLPSMTMSLKFWPSAMSPTKT